MPRPVRFIIRHFSRIATNTAPIRAGIGSAFAIGFLALAVGYGVYQGGHGKLFLSSAASTAGLQLGAIQISGQLETGEDEVLAALELNRGDLLFGLDLKKARARVMKLAWIEAVTIRKYYPDKLEISLLEKQPFAVWQRDKTLRIVEGDGKVIAEIPAGEGLSNRISMLPRIVGKGAEKRAAELFELVSPYPTLKSRINAYVRVADRRWNIVLGGDLVIRLPEHNAPRALAAVATMERERQLFSRAITVVDMRLKNRMVLRLAPGAAEQRRVTIKENLEQMRQAEKSI